MFKKLNLFVLSLIASLAMITPLTTPAVLAECESSDAGAFTAFPTWYKYLEFDANCEVESFDIPGDLWKIGLAIIEIVLRVAGLIAVGYTIFGGFKYVMSRGNPQEAAKARQTIIDAIIGIAISSLATVLVGFLGRTLTR
jgi:hypothetical protein